MRDSISRRATLSGSPLVVALAACLATLKGSPYISAQSPYIGAQSPTAAELRAKFEHRLQEIAARVDGVVGYEMLDLTSGERIAHLERETFPTASTIKLAVVYELFKQSSEGKIKLDETITLD